MLPNCPTRQRGPYAVARLRHGDVHVDLLPVLRGCTEEHRIRGMEDDGLGIEDTDRSKPIVEAVYVRKERQKATPKYRFLNRVAPVHRGLKHL